MTDKARAQGRIEAPGRGIASMIGGSLPLTLNDGVVKWVSGDFQLGQILFPWPGRVDHHHTGASLAHRILCLSAQVSRAALMVACTYLVVSGLRLMPLAKNVAITFVGLIFVTALAPLVLSEQVGWRRWTAVLVGFVGVLVMLRPGGDGLNWAVLFPASAGPVRSFAVRISCTLRLTALPKRSR